MQYVSSISRNGLLKILLATTLHDLHLQLANEEALEAARGIMPKHKITPAKFFFTAFDIEDQQ
jgi:hypothetical protein